MSLNEEIKDLIHKLVEISDICKAYNELTKEFNFKNDELIKWNTTFSKSNGFVTSSSDKEEDSPNNYIKGEIEAVLSQYEANPLSSFNDVRETRNRKLNLLLDFEEDFAVSDTLSNEWTKEFLLKITNRFGKDTDIDKLYKLANVVVHYEGPEVIEKRKALIDFIMDSEEYKNMVKVCNAANSKYNKYSEELKKAEEILEKTKDDILESYTYLIPPQFILDENFYNYAVECLYYDRCKTLGEIFNLYENFELHKGMLGKLDGIVTNLNNIELLEYHNFMVQTFIADKVKDINANIEKTNSKLETMTDTLESGFNRLDDELEKVAIAQQKSNELLRENNRLSEESLNKLTNIDKKTKSIAKNMKYARDYLSIVRLEKVLEGDWLYLL